MPLPGYAICGALDLSVGGSAGEVGSVAAVGEKCQGDEGVGVGEAAAPIAARDLAVTRCRDGTDGSASVNVLRAHPSLDSASGTWSTAERSGSQPPAGPEAAS